LPIEATILAYKALSADADAMAAAVNSKLTSDKSVLVVGTSSDIAAVVQMRIVLGQASILQKRLELLKAALTPMAGLPQYSVPPAKAQAAAGAGFITSPADVATLIQTLGSITAVNETLASGAGALNDSTLIALVADKIKAKSIVIPSQMPPNLLANNDLTGTYLVQALTSLEKARSDAILLAMDNSQALVDGQTLLAAQPSPHPAPALSADLSTAGQFVEKQPQINSIITLIGSASTAVDAFEASLFSGQAPTSSNTPSPNSNTAGNQPVAGSPNAGGAALPNPGALPPPATAPATSPTPTPQPAAQQSSSPSGGVLQQVLYADLLLHFMKLPADQSANVSLLAVHALESGGGQLTKSNLFLGSRTYFSGGAVATFSLFDTNSNLQCSGIGYGYQGYIREKDVEEAVYEKTKSRKSDPAHVTSTCK
jgi:hypothetical protein